MSNRWGGFIWRAAAGLVAANGLMQALEARQPASEMIAAGVTPPKVVVAKTQQIY